MRRPSTICCAERSRGSGRSASACWRLPRWRPRDPCFRSSCARRPRACCWPARCCCGWPGTIASASLDWFAPLLGGVTAAVAAFLIGLGLRTFVIDRERRRMALALSRYLDVHLAQQADRERPAAGAGRRDARGHDLVLRHRRLQHGRRAHGRQGAGGAAQRPFHPDRAGDRGGGRHHRQVCRRRGGRDLRRAGAAAQPRRRRHARRAQGAGTARAPRPARRARSRSASASTPAPAWSAMSARSTASTTPRSAIP